MNIVHECFKFRGIWIVKATYGNKSLQYRYERKPTPKQLEMDYQELDSLLLIGAQKVTRELNQNGNI